jgi:hypothetical protein
VSHIYEGIEWPDYFVDNDGVEHGWEEEFPLEEGDEREGEPYTYREQLIDEAGSHGLSVEEYLDVLSQEHEDADEDDDYDFG